MLLSLMLIASLHAVPPCEVRDESRRGTPAVALYAAEAATPDPVRLGRRTSPSRALVQPEPLQRHRRPTLRERRWKHLWPLL